MSLETCVFAARLGSARSERAVSQRLATLSDFYADLGRPLAGSQVDQTLGVIVGCINLDGTGAPQSSILQWGERLPLALSTACGLIGAGAGRLKSIEGVTFAVACDGEGRARVVTGAGLIAAGYHASGGEVEVWATHAVAAAYLACGRATFDQERLPELIARDFVGGGRTLVREARVIPPATVVDLDRGGTRTHTYWPPAERWAATPESEALDAAGVALRGTLQRRLTGFQLTHLGLTGGLDSTVIAQTAVEAGLAVRAFTWGDPEMPDVQQARTTARILGLDHETLDPGDLRGEALRKRAGADSAWSDGMAAVSLRFRTWPSERSAVAFGAGGEIGRAFYYHAGLAAAFPRPSSREVRRFFDGRPAIHHATRDAKELLREAERGWVADAEDAGADGWRRLDVVYADQRVRNWGRAMMPRLDVPVIGAFATPSVAGPLSSLPLRERVSDGFHRATLRRHPELAPLAPEPAPPRLRQTRIAGVPGVRLAAHHLRRLKAPEDHGQWHSFALWNEKPEMLGWITDEVLGSGPVPEVLGSRWARRTREGLLAGRRHATEDALQAAGAIALRERLAAMPVISEAASVRSAT